jgi:hypothetical protein
LNLNFGEIYYIMIRFQFVAMQFVAGLQDKRTVTAMESALELINTWNRAADGPDPIKIKGKRRISSRVKALAISQIRYGLEGLLQVQCTVTEVLADYMCSPLD